MGWDRVGWVGWWGGGVVQRGERCQRGAKGVPSALGFRRGGSQHNRWISKTIRARHGNTRDGACNAGGGSNIGAVIAWRRTGASASPGKGILLSRTGQTGICGRGTAGHFIFGGRVGSCAGSGWRYLGRRCGPALDGIIAVLRHRACSSGRRGGAGPAVSHLA